MAKKGKTIQMQSPENYIRTRARNLEIDECLINDNWKESGIANVVVTRKHTNGNFTTGIFLVDLYCLGVKDSMYKFNCGETEHREMIDHMNNANNLINIDYVLAHNIVFAAVEYAGDYGFNPCKTFTYLTKYLLEEDTDEIEIIEIECGLNGKPFYFQGIDDNQATINRILKQLERTAGEGNYHFTLASDSFKKQYKDSLNIDDDDDFDYDDDTDNDDSSVFSREEALTLFKDNLDKFDSMDGEEIKLFLLAVDQLFKDFVDDKLVAKFYHELSDDFEFEIETDNLPDALFGLPENTSIDLEPLKDKVLTILEVTKKSISKARQIIDGLKIDFKNIPFIYFLELYSTENASSNGFRQKLDQYTQLFPDYALLKTMSLAQLSIDNTEKRDNLRLVPLKTLFPGRESLHFVEMQQYLIYAIFTLTSGNEYSKLIAFQQVLDDSDFPIELTAMITNAIISRKINVVHTLLSMDSAFPNYWS